MTVRELIEKLKSIENKDMEVIATKSYFDWDFDYIEVNTYIKSVEIDETEGFVVLVENED